jgi:hypothetical protein
MTILELTDYFRNLSLRHKDVKQFEIGSWYDAASNTNDKYPLVYWELPYSIQYPDINKQVDTIQVSLSVFLSSKIDSIQDDNAAISFAKSIGDAIIVKASMDNLKTFQINGVNSVSVREYSNDSVAGMRYDLNLTVIRDICAVDVNQYFDL